MDASYKKAIITSIKQETPGVKTYTISLQSREPIAYQAGQFITFIFNHHHKEERRSFSITSTPALNEFFSFTVKRLDNGAYSRLLNDSAKEGDILYTTGSAGLFTIPKDVTKYKQVFFFAAGIGITPILPIIKTLLHTTTLQLVLIYSNSNREDVVFYDELINLKNKFPEKFQIEFLYSSSFDLSRARLSKSLLPVLVSEYKQADVADILFYICGPFSYMRMAIMGLEEIGVHEEQIKKENFNINDKPVIKATPPDKAIYSVTLSLHDTQYTFPVVYPDTILQAARKHNIPLPYSCETGRCGSCAALCTSGKVWMAYNEVLMADDIKKGLALTCTGHPIHGNISLEI